MIVGAGLSVETGVAVVATVGVLVNVDIATAADVEEVCEMFVNVCGGVTVDLGKGVDVTNGSSLHDMSPKARNNIIMIVPASLFISH